MKTKGKPFMTTNIIKIIGIAVAVLLLVAMMLGIRPIHHCCICGKAYWGKQEAIHDKPACDLCHEKWYVDTYEKRIQFDKEAKCQPLRRP